MRISEVASRTGLNVSNVRFYERKGLLTPVREENSKYRCYTEEDVKRIKQILLYRKMGVSVDNIYLLLNGQTDMREVLLRQKKELQLQIENLQGAMDLCSMVLQEEQIDDEKLDQYLNYVHKEEAKGKQFAEVEELLEDIIEYTKIGLFHRNPAIVWLFQKTWIARFVSLGFWIMIIAIPVSHLLEVYTGRAYLKLPLLVMYAVIIVIYSIGFVEYRRARKKYLEESIEK